MTHPQVTLAKSIAATAHRGQVRKGGEEYLNHPLRVASACSRFGWMAEALGWLHDVIEDTDITYAYLTEKGVDYAIQHMLACLTHTSEISYDEYILQIKTCQIREVLQVKIAGIIDNLTDQPSDKQIEKYREALWRLMGVLK